MSQDIAIVLRAGALNGECPIWSVRRQTLFWVDLRAPALHEFDPATGQDRAWEMPTWIGSYGLTETGALVALRTGLFALDATTGGLSFMAPPPFDSRRFLFNDGRCDPRGRFLVGTMYLPLKPGDETPDEPKGTPLFRYDGGGAWTPVTPDARTSNGLAFSPDGRRMYHSDTSAHTIWVWDYDAGTGRPDNRRVFAKIENVPEKSGPDGAAVDRDGFYWCAIFGMGVLHRYDPDGKLEREMRMPARYPTMPAFGGPALDTLFVTSANFPLSPEERARRPDEGALMAFRPPVPGQKEPVVDLAIAEPAP